MYAILTATVAVLYVWIGLAAHGLDRILGLIGGALILAAVAVAAIAPRARWRRPLALLLLLAGALPLAVTTWWSLVTPVLATLALTLGLLAVNRGRIRRSAGSGSRAIVSRLDRAEREDRRG